MEQLLWVWSPRDVIAGSGVSLCSCSTGATIENNSSNGGSTDSQSELSLSCSVSAFYSDSSNEEEAEGIIEPYQYEPGASLSDEVGADSSDDDPDRLQNTDWSVHVEVPM